jgi:hypothetical protein
LAALLDVTLKEAAQQVVPVAVTAAEQVERLRTWASGRCLSASAPGVYRRDGESPAGRRRIGQGQLNTQLPFLPPATLLAASRIPPKGTASTRASALSTADRSPAGVRRAPPRVALHWWGTHRPFQRAREVCRAAADARFLTPANDVCPVSTAVDSIRPLVNYWGGSHCRTPKRVCCSASDIQSFSRDAGRATVARPSGIDAAYDDTKPMPAKDSGGSTILAIIR